jgi:hypothetical protein
MEIEQAERKLKQAQQDFDQANDALRKLTRQDRDETINQVLSYARIARHKLAAAHKELIDAIRWQLGR